MTYEFEPHMTTETRVSATETGQFLTGCIGGKKKKNFEPQIVLWVVGLL